MKKAQPTRKSTKKVKRKSKLLVAYATRSDTNLEMLMAEGPIDNS